MKTWEMIRELSEDPKKKFKSKQFGQVELYLNHLVQVQNMDCIITTNDFFKAEWEEVEEPVSFIEAIGSGKKIKAIHEFTKKDGCDRYMTLSNLLLELSQYSSYEMRDIILNGEFYIE